MRWSKEKRILINIYRGIFLWVVGGFLLAGCGSMEQEVSRRETLDQTIILEESETGSFSKKESGESEVPLEEGTTPDFIDGTPGVRTVKNLIRTALAPVGKVLYVYGGGWNLEDTGAGEEAMSFGRSEKWSIFFEEQDENYNYRYVPGTKNRREDPKDSFYPFDGVNTYHQCGLDCSGYLGWVIYNVMTDPSGADDEKRRGYVVSSTEFAKSLADHHGFGSFSREKNRLLQPGDIVSIKGHVWMSLGTCQDGSVLIVHSTPSPSITGELGGGVQLSALDPKGRSNCEAMQLAEAYMSTYCPEWSERYEVQLKPYRRYLSFSESKNAGVFVWSLSETGLTDPEGYLEMTPEEILRDISMERTP